MADWEDLRYEDIKHKLDPRLRELHEELMTLLEERARDREPGLTHEEWERRIDGRFEQRRRARAARKQADAGLSALGQYGRLLEEEGIAVGDPTEPDAPHDSKSSTD